MCTKYVMHLCIHVLSDGVYNKMRSLGLYQVSPVYLLSQFNWRSRHSRKFLLLVRKKEHIYIIYIFFNDMRKVQSLERKGVTA